MAEKQKQSTIAIAEELILPILQKYGLTLWDVVYEKEGSQWYLRYFIDKEQGITLDDCETVNREIGKLLDERDPIPHSYILEVGSPGIDRFLKKEEHFQAFMGEQVEVRLIRPINGARDFVGVLERKDGPTVTIAVANGESLVFDIKEAAFVRLYIDFETGGLKE